MKYRLPPQPGEWINRETPINFCFEGDSYQGFAGDVIATALLANDVRLMGRSFKYHRARSAYSLAGHDANALFSDGVHTHLRGDSVPLQAGMDLHAVNIVGSLKKDTLNLVEIFSRFMPVGFYYKAFHRPASLFPFHEKQIRKIAGLGSINAQLLPSHSPKDYAWCDVLVVGSGPTGLAAAQAAATSGASVLLVEEQPHLGGSLAWQYSHDPQSQQMLQQCVQALTSMDNVKIRCATQVGGHYSDQWIALVDAEHLTKLRAKAVVYATGTMEQPAVFGHNDLPGVWLASAVQRLINLYAVKPCKRAVIMAANSEAYGAALDMHRVGIDIAAIVDLRPTGESSTLATQVAATGIPIHNGYAIYQAQPTSNKNTIRGAVIAPLNADGTVDTKHSEAIPCDGIVVSVGWMPNAALPTQAGVKFTYNEELHQLVPSTQPDGIFVAGRARGIYELAAQQEDGRRAGLVAAQYIGLYSDAIPTQLEPSTKAHSHPYPIFPHYSKKNFVDFDEDLHLSDFVNAHQEGYDSVELLKRYSTVGMGPSQGKLSNMNATRILAQLNKATINQTGTTTSRPFYQPVPLGHLAGRRFHPMRQTPIHLWHKEHNAVFYHAGDWYRPEYYAHDATPRPTCILQEAQQVRDSLGIIDVSTLGKLLINGPDAAAFIERIYTGRFKKLAVGRYRYGVALDESGVVIEDGVIARLAPNRFYVTATSSGVGAFYRELQRWAMIWNMQVSLSNVTGHLAALNLAGPQSRQTLAPLTDIDLDPATFPYLGVREGQVAGLRALVIRVGFVGELGYEVHVPATNGDYLWRTLFTAGKLHGIRPFGVEAQRLLRLEKGHLIVGHDTDALTYPAEAGLSWAIGKNKAFFIGQRALKIYTNRLLTRTLVGICWPSDYQKTLPEECNLLIHQNRIIGRITSIAPQSTLGYPLAMAFVEPAMANPGTTVEIRLDNGSMCSATIATMPFYDPDDQRQEM